MSKLTFTPVVGGPKPKSVLEYEKALKKGLESLSKEQRTKVENSSMFGASATKKILKASKENKTISLTIAELFGE